MAAHRNGSERGSSSLDWIHLLRTPAHDTYKLTTKAKSTRKHTRGGQGGQGSGTEPLLSPKMIILMALSCVREGYIKQALRGT